MKLAKKGPQQLNDQIVSLGAMRYALGRQSYAVSATIDWLNDTYSQFSENTRNVMIRDVVEALQDECAGSKICDEPAWRYWASYRFAALDKESQDWIRHAVAYRHKDWPLLEIPPDVVDTNS
jgi:hypothetical protein